MSGTSPAVATRMDRLQNHVTGSLLLNVIENTAKLNKKTTSSSSASFSDELKALQTKVNNMASDIQTAVLKNPAEAQTISNDLTLSDGKLTVGSSEKDEIILTVNGNAQFGNSISLDNSYIRSGTNSGVIFSRNNESEGTFDYLTLNASSDNGILDIESASSSIKFHNNIKMVDLDSFTVGESGKPVNNINLNATDVIMGGQITTVGNITSAKDISGINITATGTINIGQLSISYNPETRNVTFSDAILMKSATITLN